MIGRWVKKRMWLIIVGVTVSPFLFGAMTASLSLAWNIHDEKILRERITTEFPDLRFRSHPGYENIWVIILDHLDGDSRSRFIDSLIRMKRDIGIWGKVYVRFGTEDGEDDEML